MLRSTKKSCCLLLLFVGFTLLLIGTTAGYAKSLYERSKESKDKAPATMNQKPKKTSEPRKQRIETRITKIELQSKLMNFADRYIQYLTQAASTFEQTVQKPQARYHSINTNLSEATSAVDIASSPDSETALLDMVVLVTLQRMVWEDYWRPKVYGESADIYVEALKVAETEIWKIADIVLSKQQRIDLKNLILDWRRDHPDQWLVSYIRFSEFGESGRKSSLIQAAKSGGLLAPVREATVVIDEVRLLAERAMYKLSRMQLMVNMQADIMFLGLIQQPEVERLFTDTNKFMETTERLSATVESLPDVFRKESTLAIDQAISKVTVLRDGTIQQFMDRVTIERQGAVDQIMASVAKEREIILGKFEAEEEDLRSLLTEMRNTMAAGTELASSVSSTLTTVNSLTSKFELDELPGMKDYLAVLSETSKATLQLGVLLKSMQELMILPQWNERLPQMVTVLDRIQVGSQELVNHAFFLGIALILLFLIGALLTGLAYRYLCEKKFEQNPVS